MKQRLPILLSVTALAVAVCAGLAGAVLLAGCGGDASSGGPKPKRVPLTKADYQARLSQIVASVSAKYGTVPINPSTISNGNLAKAEQGLRVLADRLARVNPPTEVATLHADYVEALRSLADELPELTAQMGDDPAAGLDVLLGSESVQALLRAAQGFSEKGYDLNPDRP
jgi:hypothetical protein